MVNRIKLNQVNNFLSFVFWLIQNPKIFRISCLVKCVVHNKKWQLKKLKSNYELLLKLNYDQNIKCKS